MATIQDYVSGKVCRQIEQAFSIFGSVKGSLEGSELGDAMLNTVRVLAPKRLTVENAMELIQGAKQCAIGERVCRSLHGETPLTESVFLDDLATSMAEAGKARLASGEEAMENIKKYAKSPLIVSKVSGSYAEICPTWPRKCLYWNMEKHKLKCINRIHP